MCMCVAQCVFVALCACVECACVIITTTIIIIIIIIIVIIIITIICSLSELLVGAPYFYASGSLSDAGRVFIYSNTAVRHLKPEQ